MPALVVAIAPNPAFSKMRALATSQAFGSTRIFPRCIARKAFAFDFCSSILMTTSTCSVHSCGDILNRKERGERRKGRGEDPGCYNPCLMSSRQKQKERR